MQIGITTVWSVYGKSFKLAELVQIKPYPTEEYKIHAKSSSEADLFYSSNSLFQAA